MSREAMKLALEALENAIHPWEKEGAITALREALANEALDKMAENARELGLDYEPAQQEPVAWVCYGSNNKHDIDFFEDEIADLAVGTKLYTHAQRTWVNATTWRGLTDEEIAAIYLVNTDKPLKPDWLFARAIEAKLKEKNT